MATHTVTGATGASLETLISTLQGGVVGIPPEAAIGAIIHWENALFQTGDADYQAIATDLATLRGALTADNLDPVTIGEVLQSLGNRVQNASGAADNAIIQQLLELGDILNQEGANLAGVMPQMSDTGAGKRGQLIGYEQSGPEVSSGSLTTGASFTSGSTTMQGRDPGLRDIDDVVDNLTTDIPSSETDNAQTGRTGGGI